MERMLMPCMLCVMMMLSFVKTENEKWPPSEFYKTEYPNPMEDPKKCGRNDRFSYICNPNSIINEEEARQLDNEIKTVYELTPCPCSANLCNKNRRGYQIAIALVKQISRHAKGSVTTTLPTTTAHHKTEKELQEEKIEGLKENLDATAQFAQELGRRWNFGQCNEVVIIIYSLMDNVVYTQTSIESEKVLKNYLINEIQMNARKDLSPQGNIMRGLLQIITNYKLVFMRQYNSSIQVKYEPEVGRLTSQASKMGMTLTSVLATFFSLLLVFLQ